jgi:hypothetical protein
LRRGRRALRGSRVNDVACTPGPEGPGLQGGSDRDLKVRSSVSATNLCLMYTEPHGSV